MRGLLLVAAVVAALVFAGASSSRLACTPGVRSAGGASYRTFCGPAHATLKAGGKLIVFKGGDCVTSSTYFTINIGTITLGICAKPRYTYFGITIFGKTDGTYTNSGVTWQFPGKGESIVHATITLSGGRSKGTFSGKQLFARTFASGSFACR